MVTIPAAAATPWVRLQILRIIKGVPMTRIEATMQMNRGAIRQMLLGHYGYPATPEKMERLLAALNTGTGDPVTEAHIRGDEAAEWSAPPLA